MYVYIYIFAFHRPIYIYIFKYIDMYFTDESKDAQCHIYQILDPHKSTRDPEERTHGPLRYNVATGKLTFGDSYHYKPDAEGLEVGGGFNTL